MERLPPVPPKAPQLTGLPTTTQGFTIERLPSSDTKASNRQRHLPFTSDKQERLPFRPPINSSQRRDCHLRPPLNSSQRRDCHHRPPIRFLSIGKTAIFGHHPLPLKGETAIFGHHSTSSQTGETAIFGHHQLPLKQERLPSSATINFLSNRRDCHLRPPSTSSQ